MYIMIEYMQMNEKLAQMMTMLIGIKKEIEAMENTMEDLGIFWNSDASEEYAIKNAADLYNAKALVIKLLYSIKELHDFMENMDKAERHIGALIDGG